MNAPQSIIDLVEQFDRSFDQKHAPGYNEEMVRTEFVNPFFEALDWDIRNTQGKIETYKDVVMEAAVKVGGATKLADYSFRLGGRRVFFVETKKPAVSLTDNPEPAMQLRGYGWSAKLALSVLTDFEEFAIYDCRVRPIAGDKPGVARLKLYSYKDYLTKWDEIADLLSPEAIQRGSFEQYARGKKGTDEVDNAFLKQIEGWRDVLARNIANRNKEQGLGARDLNYAVQKIIDRIIFLRICEDRGIEDYGQLEGLLADGDIYPRLTALFNRADERYNSGLFHFGAEKGRFGEPDTLTPTLNIDDGKLKEIIKSLYPPQNYYNFYYLSADILGQVYEQFLGKVIRVMPAGGAKVEDKPEVKKAGGVYYTPTYIVDYIVENTVGKLLSECKKPSDTLRLRILDPACGSGSFLIGAYQYLLDWYRDWYVNDGAEKHHKKVYRGLTGEWRLTTVAKREILLANIYGVDIDAQAVEVTKLSLLLKVLENETEETIQSQLKMFKERALPDLGSNIKCGNSLIGPDFYEGQQMTMLDQEEIERINVFDWDDDERGFGEIMKGGGFDAVIGNPPYVRMEGFKELKPYLSTYYKSHNDRADIYYYFIEKALGLLKMSGRFGYIVSNSFAKARTGTNLRELISQNYKIENIVDFGDFVPFKGPTTYPYILIIGNDKPSAKSEFYYIDGDFEKHDGFITVDSLGQSSLTRSSWIIEKRENGRIRDKICKAGEPLGNLYSTPGRGIVSGLNEAFIITQEEFDDIRINGKDYNEVVKPYLRGTDIGGWRYDWVGLRLIYAYHGVDLNPFPELLNHIQTYKKRLEKRATKQKWYELQQPQYAYVEILDKPKIIYPDISREPKFCLDENGMYFSNTTYFIDSDSKYLLGSLNSKLMWFIIGGLGAALRGGKWRYRLFTHMVEKLPIRVIDFSDAADVARYDRMVELVEAMLELNKRLQAAKTPPEKESLKSRIAATDRHIDTLVYELYGLTDEEIKVVEGK